MSRHELQRNRDLIPEDEDPQNEWEAAVDDPEKYVSLLIGQKDDEEQRAESNEENYHNPFKAEQKTQNCIDIFTNTNDLWQNFNSAGLSDI